VSIDYTILGVLIEEPSHGYSIKKYLHENVSRDLGINDGQLYPALGRLEERGWIRKRVVPQRRSPTKHLYRVTPDGETAFYRWLLEPACSEADSPRYAFYWKDEFLQRLAFFRYLAPERVQEQVQKRIEEVSKRIADLEGVAEQIEARGGDPYRRMIAEYGIRYQCMWREWLEALLAATREVDAPSASRPSQGREHVRFG
jgi:DNA-binding PadR family transcriptional regulator